MRRRSKPLGAGLINGNTYKVNTKEAGPPDYVFAAPDLTIFQNVESN